MDSAGPGRPAEGRPDVRLSAARAGQGALLEDVTDAGSCGQPGPTAPVIRRGFHDVQPAVLPDGLLAQGTAVGAGVRAVQKARGRAGSAPRRRLPAAEAQNAAAHAHAAAVPVAGVRYERQYHHGTARGHVDVRPAVAPAAAAADGRRRFGGREQTAAGRQSAAAVAVPFRRGHQDAVGRRGGPNDGDDSRPGRHRGDRRGGRGPVDVRGALQTAAAAADHHDGGGQAIGAAAAADHYHGQTIAAAAAADHHRDHRQATANVPDHTGPFPGENVRAAGQQVGRPAAIGLCAVVGRAGPQSRGPRRVRPRRAQPQEET